MGKFEESFNQKTEEYIELGKKNREYLDKADGWCKHFRAELETAGLLAQQTNLPIGSFKISCQFAENASASMNLPWIIPDFIKENCKGCPHHAPNGNEEWGNEIIKNHEQQIEKKKRRKEEREKKLKELRKQVRQLPNQAKKESGITERDILTGIENLFSDNESERERAFDLLKKAAEIAYEDFSSVAVEILIENSLNKEFSNFCLPVCAILSRYREDLKDNFRELSIKTLKKGLQLETSAEILVHTIESYPLEKELIHILIANQTHNRPIMGFKGGRPSYPNSTQLLADSYEKKSASVLNQLRNLLLNENEIVRINVCGALISLQKIHPRIGVELLPELLKALDFKIDPHGDSADAKIKKCITNVFLFKPAETDEFIFSKFPLKRPAVKEEIIELYRRLTIAWKDLIEDEQKNKNEVYNEDEILFNRCFSVLRDENLSVEVRKRAADTLKDIGRYRSPVLLKNFDALLGYYALICEADLPKEGSGLIIPGQKSRLDDPFRESSNKLTWSNVKIALLNSIKEVAKSYPEDVTESLIGSFKELDSKTQSKFKGAVVELLGEVGSTFEYKPKVLPLMMNALMDYESQLIRAKALKALNTIYKYSQTNPPTNIVDIIVVHLRDQYVIVHKAAMRVLRFHTNWLNSQNAVEAIELYLGWLPTYKEKAYELDDMIETILRITDKFAVNKNLICKCVLTFFPTKEFYPDENIIKSLISTFKPSDEEAKLIVPQVVWFLGTYQRDIYSSHRYSDRKQMFEWLHQLPGSTFKSCKESILSSAKKLAEKDPWDACNFASLMSKFNYYEEEKNILEIACDTIEGEKRYEELLNNLNILLERAELNNKSMKD